METWINICQVYFRSCPLLLFTRESALRENKSTKKIKEITEQIDDIGEE
jgi:hypothetical protein